MGGRWHYREVDSHPAHTIRAARREDAEDIAAIYATFVAMSAATFEEQVPTHVEMEQRMTARPRLPWLVAEVRTEPSWGSPMPARTMSAAPTGGLPICSELV